MGWKKFALLIGVVLLGGVAIQKTSSSDPQCPHPKYQQKHLCSGEATEANALGCSRARANNPSLSRTSYNTVLFGQPSYVVAQDGCCINEVTSSIDSFVLFSSMQA